MIRTAKEWAEVFAKIADKDPDQKVWAYCYTRDEVEVHNSPEPDGNISEADWNDIIGEFDGLCSGSALEPVWEAFSDAVGSELSHIRCDDCYEYDYQVKGEKYERKCANCGEEQDLLDQ
jgi:hypothetical protein